MAKLKSRRSKWYARVRIWANDIRKEKEIQIPLKTESRVTALERLSAVNKVESDIKNGILFTFPWMNDDTQIKVSRFTVSDAIKEWMNRRKKMGIRPKTLEINSNGLKHFTDVIGNTCPLEAVTVKMIDSFVDYLQSRGLSITSINIHLRTVKSMFRYYWKRERLDKIPMIEQIKKDESNPIYINDAEFQSIMELDWLDKFYKRVFYFYRETGCRLRETFISSLDGSWLDIPNLSKGKKPRSIELSESLMEIFNELKSWLETRYGSTLVDPAGHISKMFKKILRSIGADETKHFHSLRHTYAVRRIVENVPVYKVQKMMGHSSVVTTEIYFKLDLKRLKRDFPTINTGYYEPVKSVFRDTKIRDTINKNYTIVESEMTN